MMQSDFEESERMLKQQLEVLRTQFDTEIPALKKLNMDLTGKLSSMTQQYNSCSIELSELKI